MLVISRRARRAPHTTVRTNAPVSPVREFAPHPREMGAYKRSSTWSKEGDRERDAAVRAQWRKLSHDPATLTRACAPVRPRRLAPETESPGGAMDMIAALKWVLGLAGDLAVDTGRISLFGDAGGGTDSMCSEWPSWRCRSEPPRAPLAASERPRLPSTLVSPSFLLPPRGRAA